MFCQINCVLGSLSWNERVDHGGGRFVDKWEKEHEEKSVDEEPDEFFEDKMFGGFFPYGDDFKMFIVLSVEG